MNFEASTGKETILKNIRAALTHATSIPFPNIEKTEFEFDTVSDDLAILFAERFTSLLGKFSICQSEQELVEQLTFLVDQEGWKEIYCTDENIKSALGSFSEVFAAGAVASAGRCAIPIMLANTNKRVNSCFCIIQLFN